MEVIWKDAGKPDGGMNTNMENEWSVEECRKTVVVAADSSPSPRSQSRGSFALPGMLARKTSDELWNDIQRDNSCERQEGQVPFGEMTLQDFLFKAGVVTEDEDAPAPASAPNHNVNNTDICGEPTKNGGIFKFAPGAGGSQSMGIDVIQNAQNLQHAAQWRQFQFGAAQQQHPQQSQQQLNFLHQQRSPYAANAAKQAAHQPALAILGNDPTGGLALDGAGNTLSFCSPVVGSSVDSPPHGKKRAPEIVLEKTVERRHQRMIKNRESAARSRARKQAYTDELENEVTQLMEENEKLKQQQFSKNLLPAVQLRQPKHVLRRNNTAPF